MATHKIGELLAESGQLKTLAREARRLAELERLIFEAAPSALAEAIRIKKLRAGTLVFLADNAAVAAKLKQLAPRLLACVRKMDPEVNGIRVQVQPAQRQKRAPRNLRKSSLGLDAIGKFQNLADGLHESPLKSALTRLVQRHKKNR
jgi:hypothetical protein